MVAIFYQKRSAYGKTIDRRQGADRTVCNAAYYPSHTAVYETERGLTEERYHDKIELSKEFVEARKSGKIKPGVNAEKQDGHYPDTLRYKEGKSRFTADRAEVEAYIEDRLGKVPIKRGRCGTIREIVAFDKPIGEYKNG